MVASHPPPGTDVLRQSAYQELLLAGGEPRCAEWTATSRVLAPARDAERYTGLTVANLADLVPVPDLHPDVTVLIPARDAGGWVVDAVCSVRAAAQVRTEVIVVDDGSRDPQSCQVLALLEVVGVTVVHQPPLGISAARNAGLSLSTAPAVLPLDADNLLRPGFLEAALPVLADEPGVGAVYGDAWRFGGKWERWTVPELDVDRLVRGNYIDNCALIRRSALAGVGGWCDTLPGRGLEDWDLWLGLVEAGWHLHHLDMVAFDYRTHPAQLNAARAVADEETVRLVRAIAGRHRSLYGRHIEAVMEDLFRSRHGALELQQEVERLSDRPGRTVPPDPGST